MGEGGGSGGEVQPGGGVQPGGAGGFEEADAPAEASWMQQLLETELRGELSELPMEELDLELEDDLGMELEPAGHRSGYCTIVGLPNAGKSTLLNRLVGQRLSIVTRKAQTTRGRVLGIATAEDHQMVLLDTPGVLRERRTRMETAMMAAVRRAMKDADAIVMLVDASRGADEALRLMAPPEGARRPPLALLLNKCDLLSPEERRRAEEWARDVTGGGGEGEGPADAVFLVSAKDGDGVADARQWVADRLPLGPRLYPREMISEHPEKFFVAEIIREKIMLQYEQEVPYATTVHVPVFKERKGKSKDYVGVDIIVERESLKGIVIGQRGSALKKLATAARFDVERFLGRPVFLDIQVKTKENWRDKDALLREYGLLDGEQPE